MFSLWGLIFLLKHFSKTLPWTVLKEGAQNELTI